MAAHTLLIRESKSKMKECNIVYLRPLKGHPIADLDHGPHQDIYHYHNLLMRGMSTVTGKWQILYPLVFCSYLTNYCSILHKFWWGYRSMSPLTADQNSAQTDTVWLSKLLIYQIWSVLKLQQNGLTKPLKSDVLLSKSSNQLKASKCPKWGMRSPSLGPIQPHLSHYPPA
jgi:hypothetical protein